MVRRQLSLYLLASLGFLLLASAPAVAQSCPTGYALVTATKIGADTPLASGVLTVTAIDQQQNPLNFSVSAVGIELMQSKRVPIVNGALANTLCLPRSDLSSVVVGYHFIARDTSAAGGNKIVLDVTNVAITASPWSLDSYQFSPPINPWTLSPPSTGGSAFDGGTVANPIAAPNFVAGPSNTIAMGTDADNAAEGVLSLNGSYANATGVIIGSFASGNQMNFGVPAGGRYTFRKGNVTVPDGCVSTSGGDLTFGNGCDVGATVSTAPAAALYLTDSVGAEYKVTLVSGSLHFTPVSGGIAAIDFTDSVTGNELALTVGSSGLTGTPISPAGTPVASVCLTDTVNGSVSKLAFTNGQLTETMTSCSSPTTSASLTDTSTATTYTLSYVAGALTLQ